MSNIILNPGFDDGTTTNWSSYFAGVGVFSADSTTPYSGGYRGKVAINIVSTAAQILQSNVPVVASTLYRVSFAAYSSGGRDMVVALTKPDGTNYGLSYIPSLGTGWAHYTIDFTTTAGAGSDARLQFVFHSHAFNGDIYYIDEVKLEKVKEITPKMFLVM